MQQKTKFYQLTYQTENVTGQIAINGFVVTEMKEKSGNGTAALNPWLIGENELKAELKKQILPNLRSSFSASPNWSRGI